MDSGWTQGRYAWYEWPVPLRQHARGSGLHDQPGGAGDKGVVGRRRCRQAELFQGSYAA